MTENETEIGAVATAITRLGDQLRSLFGGDAEETVDEIIDEIKKSIRQPDNGIYK